MYRGHWSQHLTSNRNTRHPHNVQSRRPGILARIGTAAAGLTLAGVNAIAAGTADTDVTAVVDNAKETFSTVKTAGLFIAGAVLTIGIGFWAFKKFFRK